MTLADVFRSISPSIVAFVERFGYVDDPEEAIASLAIPEPRIIGTGFVIDSNGLIATNDHVLAAFASLRPPPRRMSNECPAYVRILAPMGGGFVEVPARIIGAAPVASGFSSRKFSKEVPDIAIVEVNVGGLKPLALDPTPVSEGVELATAGYPMGTDALTAPGWVQQIGPTLQAGICSAVFPFACDEPEGFAINVMVQGGASGSPVRSGSGGCCRRRPPGPWP